MLAREVVLRSGGAGAETRLSHVAQDQSGAVEVAAGVYTTKEVGRNYAVTEGALFSDAFTHDDGADPDLTTIRGTALVATNKLACNGDNGITYPKDGTNPLGTGWKSYKIACKIARLKGSDPGPDANTAGAANIHFRCAVALTSWATGYTLRYKIDTLYLYRKDLVEGAIVTTTLAYSDELADDTDEHAVVVRLDGGLIRVWISADDAAPDETVTPTLICYDATYTTGWCGVGNYNDNAETGWPNGCTYDDLVVTEIVALEAYPPHVYAGDTASVVVGTCADITAVSLTDQGGTARALKVPGDLVGTKGGTVTFPSSFTAANTNTTGGLLLTVETAGSKSVLPLEVREQPMVRFVAISDTHYETGSDNRWMLFRDVLREIGEARQFARPEFVVHCGDCIQGDADVPDTNYTQLLAVSVLMDGLGLPYYMVAGNHETLGETGEGIGAHFEERFGAASARQSWVRNGVLFAGISYYGTWSEHHAWLAAQLAANPSLRKIAFGHLCWQQLRSDGASATMWDSTYAGGEVGRATLEADALSVAQFSGHAHLIGTGVPSGVHTAPNGDTNGVHYVGVGSIYQNQTYCYVEVYGDRMIVHRVLMHTGYADQREALEEATSDDEHANTMLYRHGLPSERDLTIRIPSAVRDLNAVEVVADATVYGDCTLTADVTLGNETIVGAMIAGLIFRRQGVGNYYAVLLDAERQKCVLQKVVAGEVTELDTGAYVLTAGVAYTVAVTMTGSSIAVDIEADEDVVGATDATFDEGTIGIKTYRGGATIGPLVVS